MKRSYEKHKNIDGSHYIIWSAENNDFDIIFDMINNEIKSDEELEKCVPLKLPSKFAKEIYKKIDGMKRSINRMSGINEELLGQDRQTTKKGE